MKKSKPKEIVSRPIQLLCDTLFTTPDEIKQYSPGIYSWGNTLYQVILASERGKTSMSHFIKVKFKGANYIFREIGDKSSLYTKPFPDII
jgi:hypothetical protein